MFTAGMTLVDSADSILMLYSYAGFLENNWTLFERITESDTISNTATNPPISSHPDLEAPSSYGSTDMSISKVNHTNNVETNSTNQTAENILPLIGDAKAESAKRRLIIKQNTMSMLSITLTLISILVAFRYSDNFQSFEK